MKEASLGLDFMYKINMKTLNNIHVIFTLTFRSQVTKP